ncbi:PHD domain-containing protein [Cryptosporidium ubiquitum]|uniref:PHD domain-containing protein n=1 Tax=Cryptosporidium ubiquitum TaxID=857276 RepID=A0A1J4MM47_9CRYT|nr:PHD domain-containing protein [Cryptosporidium ubiquitum]OII75272.1 PHD domain-containing protein [Cryptosporidium ubiquitum]
MRCRLTRLTYCTCAKGNKNFYYTGDREFKSMFENILPSSQIHELLKLLADSNEARIGLRSSTQKYRHIERIVTKEREEFNRQYEKERKRIREATSERGSDIGVSKSSECSEDTEKTTLLEEIERQSSGMDFDEPSSTHCSAEECPDKENAENVLKCNVCRKCFHNFCCSPKMSDYIKNSFLWTCSECIYCTVCKKSDRPNIQVFCDICSRCFHTSCLNPKLQKVPKNFWLCDDCKVCSKCHKLVDFPMENGKICTESLPEGFDYLDPKYGTRICYECKDKKKDLICGVCNNVLSKHGNRICSLCRMFVHNNCLNAQICNLCNQ